MPVITVYEIITCLAENQYLCLALIKAGHLLQPALLRGLQGTEENMFSGP